MKYYKVIKTEPKEHPIQWEKAKVISNFKAPWCSSTPQKSTFRAVWSEEKFFFRFDVEENNMNLCHELGTKRDVEFSDRVEIFFSCDPVLKKYYCLEIDPVGRVMDCSTSFHRQFDFDWYWPLGEISTNSKTTANGYQVEGWITMKSLKDLGLIHNNTIITGIYRADCLDAKPNTEAFKWSSWIQPDSTTPDFHIPSSFGKFILEED